MPRPTSESVEVQKSAITEQEEVRAALVSRIDRTLRISFVRELLMVIAIIVLFVIVLQVQAEQRDGIQRGYKNRAIACLALQVQGQPLPTPCREPEVAQYMR
jgi:hypothetical protein